MNACCAYTVDTKNHWSLKEMSGEAVIKALTSMNSEDVEVLEHQLSAIRLAVKTYTKAL